ncbi:MAG TPA: hypothetical protein VHT29_10685 [Solirubrobacteraceae bacterium]|jgi:hypothetical protein|nr:hypothetical protein [Solirubrobacteraceae bacterium]
MLHSHRTRLTALVLAGLCAAMISACSNTVQQQPVSHSLLEDLIVSPFPVYWLGGSFHGLSISEATHDYSGAFSVVYGNCLQGGEGACVPPLRVVSSPDNSFLPGGNTPTRSQSIRGVQTLLAQSGKTIVIATGGVVVDIYADSPPLARAAAQVMVPINVPGASEAALPVRLPNTGFASEPLPRQVPNPLRRLG